MNGANLGASFSLTESDFPTKLHLGFLFVHAWHEWLRARRHFPAILAYRDLLFRGFRMTYGRIISNVT